jgi:hypothetical protein
MIAGAIVAVTLTTGAIAYAAAALTSVPRDKVGQLQYGEAPRVITVYAESPAAAVAVSPSPPSTGAPGTTVAEVHTRAPEPTYAPAPTTTIHHDDHIERETSETHDAHESERDD